MYLFEYNLSCQGIVMNIGIDIDGVLVDIGSFMRRKGSKYFSKKYGLTIQNPNAYSAEEMFGCTHEQSKKFWTKYGLSYFIFEPCIEGGSRVIRTLHDEGHIIHIITSRALTAESGMLPFILRILLRRWFRKYRIPFSEIVFCSEHHSAPDKLRACIKHNIDAMIDDTPDNLLAFRDHMFTICYNRPWNDDLDTTGMVRVDSWDEIYRVLHEQYAPEQ